jgi:hypothetical protein
MIVDEDIGRNDCAVGLCLPAHGARDFQGDVPGFLKGELPAARDLDGEGAPVKIGEADEERLFPLKRRDDFERALAAKCGGAGQILMEAKARGVGQSLLRGDLPE